MASYGPLVVSPVRLSEFMYSNVISSRILLVLLITLWTSAMSCGSLVIAVDKPIVRRYLSQSSVKAE